MNRCTKGFELLNLQQDHDQERQIEKACFKSLIIRFLNYGIFAENWDDNIVTKAIYLISLGRLAKGNSLAHTGVKEDTVFALTIAEFLSSSILEDLSLPQAEARDEFINAVTNLRNHPMYSKISSSTSKTFAGYLVWAVPDIPERDRAAIVDSWKKPTTNFEHSYHILMHIVKGTSGTFQVTNFSLLTHVYCAAMKRGAVGAGFAQKVSNTMFVDLKIKMTIRTEGIKIFYAKFGERISSANIKDVINRWTNLLPDGGLKLSLIMKQANTGLTALTTVGKAINRYRNFKWSIVRNLYPDEWNAWMLAVQTVGGDVYYGCNLDLGIVRSSLYKNLAWVAKELLIKIGDETCLETYAGWTKRAKQQVVVEKLILQYEEHRGDVLLSNGQEQAWPDEDCDAMTKAFELIQKIQRYTLEDYFK